MSDISSNTVSLLVSENKVVGAFDACVFAPGTKHGALDVDAIRKVDDGELSANDAFTTAGASYHLEEQYQNPAIALWAAMECASLLEEDAEDPDDILPPAVHFRAFTCEDTSGWIDYEDIEVVPTSEM